MDLHALSQEPIKVLYDGVIIGEYFADVLVDGKVILEIKAAKTLLNEHESQLLNYLKATNIEVGLLLNFGPKPEIKRKALIITERYHVNLRESASNLNIRRNDEDYFFWRRS